MTNDSKKPLFWEQDPEIGYTVERRPDGGMNIHFARVDRETLMHWREFALQHLFNSDRLTRNLYDLRDLESLPDEAIEFALEANSDPSTRNIRLAVVVANDSVAQAMRRVADLSKPAPGGGAEMKIFTDIAEAENWLERPLEMI